MPTLKLVAFDQETFMIAYSLRSLSFIGFELDQLDNYVKSCLSQRKNMLIMKNSSSSSLLCESIDPQIFYQNKEKLLVTKDLVFIPHRFRKKVLGSPTPIDWLDNNLRL